MTRSVMFMVPRTYKLAKTVLKERLGKSSFRIKVTFFFK